MLTTFDLVIDWDFFDGMGFQSSRFYWYLCQPSCQREHSCLRYSLRDPVGASPSSTRDLKGSVFKVHFVFYSWFILKEGRVSWTAPNYLTDAGIRHTILCFKVFCESLMGCKGVGAVSLRFSQFHLLNELSLFVQGTVKSLTRPNCGQFVCKNAIDRKNIRPAATARIPFQIIFFFIEYSISQCGILLQKENAERFAAISSSIFVYFNIFLETLTILLENAISNIYFPVSLILLFLTKGWDKSNLSVFLDCRADAVVEWALRWFHRLQPSALCSRTTRNRIPQRSTDFCPTLSFLIIRFPISVFELLGVVFLDVVMVEGIVSSIWARVGAAPNYVLCA